MELLLKCFNEESVPPQGQVLRMPAAGRLPRLPAQGHHLVPRPKHLPVEIWMPIASGKTIDLMAQLRPQGHGDAERREDPRRRGARLPRRLRASTAGRSSSART